MKFAFPLIFVAALFAFEWMHGQTDTTRTFLGPDPKRVSQAPLAPDGFPDPATFMICRKEPEILNLDTYKNMLAFPPLSAHTDEMHGKVVFRILFDAEGKYVRHIVLKDPYTPLTEIYLSQIKILEASPALNAEGEPVPAWLTVPLQVHFIR